MAKVMTLLRLAWEAIGSFGSVTLAVVVGYLRFRTWFGVPDFLKVEKLFLTKGVKMDFLDKALEGKEAEGKIGNVGSYYVDVLPSLKVESELKLGVEQDLIAKAPGGLKVKANLTLEIDSDPLLIASMELAGRDNAVAKFIAAQIEAIRKSEDVHPAVAAAAASVDGKPVTVTVIA